MKTLIRLCAAAMPTLLLCLTFSSTPVSSSAAAAAAEATALSSVSGSGPMWGPVTFKATLTSDGVPLAGKSVVFTAGGNPAGSATTDADGVATLSTKNGIDSFTPGVYPNAVGAAFAGDEGFAGSNAAGSLSVTKADQVILFSNLRDRVFGEPDFRAFAFSTSAGPLTFAAEGRCSVVTLNVIHLTGAGSCKVTASSAGNNNFNPASASATFSVTKAFTTTTVTSSVNPSALGQLVAVSFAVTSNAGTPTGLINFKVDGPSGATITSGNFNAGSASVLGLDNLAPGTYAVTASYDGDDNFQSSSASLAGGQVVGSAFGFGQSSYAAAEGGGLTITVRRAGDTTQAAAVDYATDDGGSQDVVVPCSSATGLALDRCDYTRALGTLHFAPGEAEKTFQLLVADDSYAEGPETAHLRLSNPTSNAILGANSAAAFTITDDSPESSGNPADDSAKFVAQHYRDFLGREPDAAGLAFWTNEIEKCGADQQCREVRRINVSAAFFLSIEAQETGYLAYRMYKAAYGDAVSPNVAGTVPTVRLDEFLADAREIGFGVSVGQDFWQDRLEANKQAYASEFVRRARFAAAFPASMTATQFVEKLEQNAGVTLPHSDREIYISTLESAPSDAFKRGLVLRAVADTAQLRQSELNRAFVLMEYFGYLRRNPNEAPEPTLNFGGWRFWLTKLEGFGGNFVQAEMVKAFINSDEYRHRFGQ